MRRNAVLLRWAASSSRSSGTLTGIFVSRVVGGHIVESWAQWDQAGVLERLGLPPANAPSSASR